MLEADINKRELQIAIIGTLNILISDIDLIAMHYSNVDTVSCNDIKLKVSAIKRQAQKLVEEIKEC